MAGIMTVRAPDSMQQELKDIAQQQGLTRNALILQILWDWIESKKELKDGS